MCNIENILADAGVSSDQIPEASSKIQDIMNEASNKALKEVAKKKANKILALTQNFQKETKKIASMDKVAGVVAPKRVSPIPLNSAGTNTKGHHPDLNSSSNEDYPNSEVTTDAAGNWKKVNKVTKQVDWVHSSGSKISFYANGDVVLHVLGNMKHFVEGDYLLEVGNNYEVTVGNDKILTIKGNYNETVEIAKTETMPMKTETIPLKVLLGGLETKIAKLKRMGNASITGNVSASNNISAGNTVMSAEVITSSLISDNCDCN